MIILMITMIVIVKVTLALERGVRAHGDAAAAARRPHQAGGHTPEHNNKQCKRNN